MASPEYACPLKDADLCRVFQLSQKQSYIRACSELCFNEFKSAYVCEGVETALDAANTLLKCYLRFDRKPLVLVALSSEDK